MTGPVLVVGLATTGEAVVRRLRAEGVTVTVVEDAPEGEAFAARAREARKLGALVVERPDPAAVGDLAAASALVVPSPLVDPRHPAVRAARAAGVPVRSEIDLAAERAKVPIVAVTGTNGKTTVTTLVAAMLAASGIRATAAGNIGRTLLDAVGDDVDVLVAEVSSFQLEFTEVFRPRVAVLLAVAPDHLDWHGSFTAYAAAKARVFARQAGDDLLVFDADDAVTAELARGAPARRIGCSLDPGATAGYHTARGVLLAPDGRELVAVANLPRAFPHDVANALAAAATALDLGARPEPVAATLRTPPTLPHRVALVGEAGGVRWYDDSKATNPHAALAAIRSFPSVVLLAGGRNKGLDLGALTAAAGHLRAVVAFGEAAPEVAGAFAGVRPVVRAGSMAEAVRAGARLAQRGDAVLLAPACASFDAYPGYAARGDDFAAAVAALLASEEVVAP